MTIASIAYMITTVRPLQMGSLIMVHAGLVRPAKNHFHTLECGVRAILGNNGLMFLD